MKEYHYYTSDMMHCRQSDCSLKKGCYRYWLGQQKKAGMVTMFRPEKTPENCNHFLNIKDY